MRRYKCIPYWENASRIKTLRCFLSLVNEYQNSLTKVSFLEVRENAVSQKKRSEINTRLDKAHSIILASGCDSIAHYAPPAATGGLAGSIDLIHNMFNLPRMQVSYQQITDLIERSIGIYEADSSKAFARTINPFFWLGLILDFISELPFIFLGKIGFDQKKVEGSWLGRIVKGVLYLVTVFAAFLTILEKLGCLEQFKVWLLKRF